MSRFKRGVDFPNEGFVQAAIERHFTALGFDLDTGSHADLVCTQRQTGERWLIEAKGLTTEVGLDFRTGLGQLVQRMADKTTRYGLAVPEHEGFLSQCRAVAPHVRQALQLNWLLIRSDGSVLVVPPDQAL